MKLHNNLTRIEKTTHPLVIRGNAASISSYLVMCGLSILLLLIEDSF
jgi:hypothetical protein